MNNGWVKELNLISWDDREPVYDIRTWNAEHTEYGKGVTITAGQMVVLKDLLMWDRTMVIEGEEYWLDSKKASGADTGRGEEFYET